MNSLDVLPTTPLERYLARPSHGQGMVFDIVLMLEGEFRVDLLRQAWFETIYQHPCLFAKLVGRGRHQKWKLQNQVNESSIVFSEAEFAQGHQEFDCVDPRNGQGVRCFVLSKDRVNWSIQVVFHHACCDGVGAIRVFGQFAKRYSQLTENPWRNEGGTEATVKPHSPDVLNLSRKSELTARSVPNFRNLWATIRGSNVQLTHHAGVDGKCQEKAPAATIDDFRGHHRLLLSESVSGQIRSHLRSSNIKLNDWCVAVTLHILAKMSPEAVAPLKHLMVLNPVEMRGFRYRHNTRDHIGLAYVRRTHSQLGSLDDTVQSVSCQMNEVREHGTAKEMEAGIAIVETVPGGLALFERLGTFTPTAMLTCLSGLRLGKRFGVTRRNDVFCLGDAQIKDIFFDAPIPNGTNLSVATWDFAGKLAVSCRQDKHKYDAKIKSAFLKEWSRIATLWAAREPHEQERGLHGR
ncbi:hypothetical protein [Rhodopirellula sp. SWK7]|uniref:hypothetical protein n=1 Tax=Rhodopirellula sp. SWK7 TaxID=595460 RepID=UPI0002BFF769|nr:hypothetical protein [Rhodopirellula sp. SWK7]EMI45460.1 hypothetical protein RRSWK_01864 [Rhodopirellula sp. SWK7]